MVQLRRATNIEEEFYKQLRDKLISHGEHTDNNPNLHDMVLSKIEDDNEYYDQNYAPKEYYSNLDYINAAIACAVDSKEITNALNQLYSLVNQGKFSSNKEIFFESAINSMPFWALSLLVGLSALLFTTVASSLAAISVISAVAGLGYSCYRYLRGKLARGNIRDNFRAIDNELKSHGISGEIPKIDSGARLPYLIRSYNEVFLCSISSDNELMSIAGENDNVKKYLLQELSCLCAETLIKRNWGFKMAAGSLVIATLLASACIGVLIAMPLITPVIVGLFAPVTAGASLLFFYCFVEALLFSRKNHLKCKAVDNFASDSGIDIKSSTKLTLERYYSQATSAGDILDICSPREDKAMFGDRRINGRQLLGDDGCDSDAQSSVELSCAAYTPVGSSRSIDLSEPLLSPRITPKSSSR